MRAGIQFLGYILFEEKAPTCVSKGHRDRVIRLCAGQVWKKIWCGISLQVVK